MTAPHYFSPTFREWYAAGLLQRKGVDAWRTFLHASAAHETSDMRVRPLSVVRLVPFSRGLALAYAELGRNSGKRAIKTVCE